MQDNTLLVIGLVGLGVICLGLLVILFLAMLRFTGHHMLGFFTFWGRGGEDKDDGTKFIPSAKPDLRSIAANQDFDSALAKHIVQDEIEPRSTPAQRAPSAPSAFTTSPALPPAPFPDAVPRLGSRSNGRVHHNGNPHLNDDDDDDALADFLDEG
jgi:hypothetical protein